MVLVVCAVLSTDFLSSDAYIVVVTVRVVLTYLLSLGGRAEPDPARAGAACGGLGAVVRGGYVQSPY